MELDKKITFYAKLRKFFIGFIVLLTIISFILACYVGKNQMETNARVDTIVEYVRTKQPNANSTEKYQIEIDSLTRLLEFKGVKEDYYIQQLSAQSAWIGMLITMLFVIFTLVEYTVFERKMENTQERYTEYRAESKEKIHYIEEAFNELRGNILENNTSFKRDIQETFSKFANEYEKRYIDLQIGNYYQGSNTLFLASKLYYEKNKLIEALNVVADALKYQFQLIKILGNDPRSIDVIKTAKMHLEDSIGYLGLIIPDQGLKSEFQKVSHHSRVIEAFNDMLGFNHPEFRDQLVDILGLLKFALKNEGE